MIQATREFLSPENLRAYATITLDDPQPFSGGVRLVLQGFGRVRVEQLEVDSRSRWYRFSIEPAEVERLWQLCIDQDFLTIRPAERPGWYDEARPAITLRNVRGQEHTVAKWAGVEDARFEAIYQALLVIAGQARAHRPIPQPRPAWQKVLLALGLAILAIAPVWPANFLARQMVDTAGAEGPFGLVRPLLLTAAIPLLLGLLSFLELRAGRWKGFFWREFSLAPFFIGILFVISLFLILSFLIQAGLTRWGVAATATIQAKTITTGIDFGADPPTPETSYTLHYSFETGTGETHTGQARVRYHYYQSVDEGDTATVYYLPAFPRFSSLEAAAAATGRATFLFTALFTFAIWLIGLGIGAYGFWPLLKR